MDFCVDVAVLQSALQFVNKTCCLVKYTKKSSPGTISILRSTITRLVTCALDSECQLKQLKMCSVLVARALISCNDGEISELPWLAHYVAILHGIPALSWPLVLDVIQSVDLWHQLIKLLPYLPPTASTTLLTEIFLYMMPQDPLGNSDDKIINPMSTSDDKEIKSEDDKPNKSSNSDDKEQNQESNSDDKIPNQESNSDDKEQNQESNSHDKEQKQESNSHDKEQNQVSNSDDKAANKDSNSTKELNQDGNSGDDKEPNHDKAPDDNGANKDIKYEHNPDMNPEKHNQISVDSNDEFIQLLAYVSLHWNSPIFKSELHVTRGHGNATNWKELGMRAKGTRKHPQMNQTFCEEMVWESFREEPELEVPLAKSQQLVDVLLKVLEQFCWEDVDDVSRALAEFSVYNIYLIFQSSAGFTLGPIHPAQQKTDEVINRLGNICIWYDENKKHGTSKDLSPRPSDEDMLRVLVHKVPISDLWLLPTKPFTSPSNLADFVEILANIHTSSSASEWLKLLYEVEPSRFIKSGSKNLYRCLWKKMCRQIILQSWKSDRVDDGYPEVEPTLPSKWGLDIAQCVEGEVETELAVWEDDHLTQSIVLVHHRLNGWHSHLSWLLQVTNPEVIQHPSWFWCIEGVCEAMPGPHHYIDCMKLLAFLMCQDILSTKQITKLRKLLIQGFGRCNPRIQNSVLQDLSGSHTITELAELFDVDESLSGAIRSALNKLTNNDISSSMVVLSSMILQCPVMVTKSVFDRALHNPGQMEALVQVLQTLPSQLLFKQGRENQKQGNTLVAMASEQINSGSLTQRQEKNLTSLCGKLLMPYKTPFHRESQAPLVTPLDVLQGLILPYMLPDQTSTQSQTSTMSHSLLHAVVTSMVGLCPDWLSLVREAEPVVLLYITLHHVDSALGEESVGSERSDWLDLVARMVDIVTKYPELITDCEIAWLCEQTSTYHWTTMWYCYSILSHRELNLPLPREMNDLMVDLPNNVQPIDLHIDGWISVLQLVTISDLTLNLVINNLKDDLDDLTRTKIQLSIVTLLPECTMQELCRIMKFLRHMIQNNFKNKDSSSAHVTGYQLLVRCVQLFVSSISQLSESHSWSVMATILTATVKTTVLSECSGKNALSDLSHCYIITCKLLSYWPDSNSANHILTLSLDIVGQLDALLQEHKIEREGVQDVFEVLLTCSVTLTAADARESLGRAIESLRN